MIQDILEKYAPVGVDVLKNAVLPLSATGKTVESIRSEVTENRLQLLARGFFTALESGRGPRKANEEGNFKSNMLEYMEARGIGSGLSQKKKEQLARFFTWKINKEGDKTFKKGGRQIYSAPLAKFVEELTHALQQDMVDEVMKKIRTLKQDLQNVSIGT